MAGRIRILARVVPNGLVGAGAARRARISLCLMPSSNEEGPEAAAELAQWPETVAAWLAAGPRLHKHPKRSTRTGDGGTAVPITILGTLAANAGSVWRDAFTPDQFGDLVKALRDDQKTSMTEGPERKEHIEDHVLSYPIAEQAAVLETFWLGQALGPMSFMSRGPEAGNLDASIHASGLQKSLYDSYLGLFGSDTNVDASAGSATLTEAVDELDEGLLSLLGRGGAAPAGGSGLETPAPASGSAINPQWRPAIAAARRDLKDRHSRLGSYFGGIFKGGPRLESPAVPVIPGSSGKEVRAGVVKTIAADKPLNRNAEGPSEAPSLLDVAAKGFCLYHLATRRDAAVAATEAPFAEETGDEIARRKFAALTTQVPLARAVGLIVEAELDPAHLPEGHFELAVADGEQPANWLWTACEFSAGDSHFGPASLFDYEGMPNPAAAGPAGGHYRRGLLNLQARLGSADDPRRRFELVQTDVALALEAWENAVRSRRNQELQGDTADKRSTKLPELRSGAVTISDTAAAEDILRDIRSNLPGRRLLYAEDLVVGYRIDVCLTGRGGKAGVARERWRSLHEREVRLKALGTTFVRSDSWISPVARLADAGLAPGPKEVVASQALCSWSGDSLALPGRGAADIEIEDDAPPTPPEPASDASKQVTWVWPGGDVALHTEMRLPPRQPGTALGLPPRRFGCGAAFGARLVYINGGGLSLQEASVRYDRYLVLGADEPFVFRRWEEIQSPVLLLDKRDRLASSKNLGELKGEQLQTMVIRSGAGTPKVTRAYRRLAAPRAPLDLVELHGVFDGNRAEDQPRGAYDTFKLDRATGEFKSLPPAASGAPAPAPGEERPSLGAVFPDKVDPNRPDKFAAPDQPYYPDPLAERCCLVFVRNGRTPPGFGQSLNNRQPLIVTLNPRRQQGKQWPLAAQPVTIELKTLEDADNRLRGLMKAVDGPQGPVVEISLAPGETIELWAWCVPSDPRALQELALIHAGAGTASDLAAATGAVNPNDYRYRELAELMSRLVKQAPTAGSDEKSLAGSDFDRAFARAPIPGLSTPLKMTLVHASHKPAMPPRFESVQCPGGKAFALVRAAQPTWTDLLGKARKDICKQLAIPEAEGVTSAFIVGRASVESPSTGRLEVQAQWAEHGPDVALRKLASGGWEYAPQSVGWQSLTTLDVGRMKAGGDYSSIDLAFDELGQATSRSFDFRDGAARALKVRLVAHSRYEPFFDAASGPSGDLPATAIASAETLPAMVKATRRPPPPDLLEAEVLPVQSFAANAAQNWIEVVRRSAYRLRLANCFRSGVGERLGLAMWPDLVAGSEDERQQAQRFPVDALEKAENLPFGSLVTRRGHDPLFRSGLLERRWLQPDDVAGGKWDRLLMPFRGEDVAGATGGGGGALSSAPVAVVGFDPVFDASRGDWYCDVELDPAAAYAPFVRLSLVHWQPNSIPMQELSTPVTTWARLLPQRTLKVSAVGKKLQIEVRGRGYRQTASEAPEAQSSRLSFRLLERVGERWRTAVDAGSREPYIAEASGTSSHGQMIWKHEFALPSDAATRRYAVHVEEFGWIPGDDAGAAGGSELVKAEQIYQCLVDLHDHPDFKAGL